MNKKKKIKVLMELRPALEGFAGIPQETRLIYNMLQHIDNVEVTGLINHYRRVLASGLVKADKWSSPTFQHKRIYKLSRHIVSYTQRPYQSWFEKLVYSIKQRTAQAELAARARLGLKERIYHFDPEGFEDFIWNTLFSKSLPVSEYDVVTRGKFSVLQAPWVLMHLVGIGGGFFAKYPRINTRGYDFFLSQTPYPAYLTAGTRLLVRYHDAIPIFLPHTIPDTSRHQAMHYWALRHNVAIGAHFICTSEATRNDLVKIFPRAEKNTCVIHDVVSHNYFKESAPRSRLVEIVRARIEPDTEPKFLMSREKVAFYARHLKVNDFRYIMMVSTIEPRKNHLRLIGAWDILRHKLNEHNLKLLIVGRPGWHCDQILEAMRPWQERGQIFNLSRVPAGDLRVLYNGAEAVVCPSLAEGFDLSGVEAMLCGAPVVASDIPVHTEVYGEAAEYFNPYSTMQMAEALLRVIGPGAQERRQELIEYGKKYAQRYKRENILPKWQELLYKLKSRRAVKNKK